MPERFPTKNPTVLIGSTVESGVPNTGQSPWTQGGTRVHTVFSGTAGGDANIWVGGGRLDAAIFHDSALQALSGQPVVFYDSAVAVSGGPLATSGHKVVGVLAPAGELASTAISGAALRGGIVRQLGFTFSSGLCHTGRSGGAGWSASYTTVVSG
jgi:hypothetical protein